MPLSEKTFNAAPAAATETDLISSSGLSAGELFANFLLIIAERGGSTTTVSVRLVKSGDTAGDEHYILKDAELTANDSQFIPIKAMGPGDELKVEAASANVTFTANGFLKT